jgi:hypothetical protein
MVRSPDGFCPLLLRSQMLTCSGYVQPFGPTDTPSSRGSPFPRGRGRGRGGLGATPTPASPRLDSGQSTPVRGLGHRGRGGGLGDRPSSGYKGKSTVGREGVTWGGRGAPLFVKGGELFKDGEVDIVRRDESRFKHFSFNDSRTWLTMRRQDHRRDSTLERSFRSTDDKHGRRRGN